MECEIKIGGMWQRITLAQALALDKSRIFRCIECEGRVRAHQEGNNGQAPHFEHEQRNPGCSLGDCFNGVPAKHLKRLT